MNTSMQVMVGLNKAYLAKRGGGSIANFTELNLLDAGALAILDENNNLIPSTVITADLAGVQQFRFAMGMPNAANTPRLSVLIDRNAYTQWFNTYEAPVLEKDYVGKVATVGVTGLPGSFANGTYATVIVTDTTLGMYLPGQTKRYTVAVTAASNTATILAAIVALINADADAIVTAATLSDASNDYISLTSKAVGTNFKTGADDLLINATISTDGTNGSASGFTGFGTQAKVAKAVEWAEVAYGDSSRNYMHGAGSLANGFWNLGTILDGLSGLTFSGWTFQWKEEAVRATDVIQTGNPVVAVFVQVGAAQLATITTIMGVMGLAPSAEAGMSNTGTSSGEGATPDGFPTGGQG